MKIMKKILPAVLAAALVISTVTPIFAVGTPSEKEEVIYINLTADGSVKEMYAVNIFGKGNVTDYGDYSSAEMLNTKDKISQNGDMLTFYASADRTYLKGKMESDVIPWDISIRYYIDGKEYTAKEIAGKSGKLKIEFRVSENENCEGSFFDNYALQATFTLDTEKCENIAAENATIANVGGKKQISYTMLPGEGIDTYITADVTDFEMDAAAINGIPLSLNIEIDDSELADRINELIDAVAKLDDGAGELSDGISELQNSAEGDLHRGSDDLADGAEKLHDGAGELKDGSAALNDGTSKLKSGASSLNDGVERLNSGVLLIEAGLLELDEKSSELTEGSSYIKNALSDIQQALSAVSLSTEQLDLLVSGSSEMKEGIASLESGIAALQNNVSFAVYKAAMKQNNLDIDELQAANGETIRSLEEQISNLNNQISELDSQITYLEAVGGDEAQIEELKSYRNQLYASERQLGDIKTLIEGNSAAISGMDLYLTQINGSICDLAAGAAELKEKYEELDNGINTLATEIKGLISDMNTLKAGIDALVFEYEKLDGGISDYTDGIARIAAGYSEIVSGTESLLGGSRDLKNGTAELYGKTGELVKGVSEFYGATSELKDGTDKLSNGVTDLLEGIAKLYDGSSELKDGTSEMREETDGMNDEISEKIDDMIESITGENAETVSFVSEKNTNVKSVQFVIQTEKIEIAETENYEPEAKEELTFWQKILRLFGLC